MRLPTLFLLLFCACSCQLQDSCSNAASRVDIGSKPVDLPSKIDGITFVAPPEPFFNDPFQPLHKVGAKWIAVVPYGFTRPGTTTLRFQEQAIHWWGESVPGVRSTIEQAHASGLKVMLKPQVFVPGGWTGQLDFESPEDWEKWESGYERFLLRFAAVADSTDAEMLCIGTELQTSIRKRPEFWNSLIKKVRAVYKGKLTYSSNWDDWDKVPFWAQLDFIGLGGYFPLVEAPTPSVDDLKQAWAPVRARLKAFSESQQRPVLFTEFGYLSVDGCGWRNWELENGIEMRQINEQAQANCYEALFATFYPENWWAGGFLWKWFPNMRGHEGYPERDYTPQGKIAEKALQKWYLKQ